MTNFSERVAEVLKKSNCITFSISAQGDHQVLISMPATDDFEFVFSELEEKVTDCLNTNLPEREENVHIEVISPGKGGSFMVY